ncbi:MAG: photosystem II biogenesis protein Psp29 [Microcystaceae cyanobacterium]
MNKVRTVSDTKRDFYTFHTRPINSVYRRVIEELMVEMHLLSVNVDFHSDPIYILGVVTSFDRFMQGYRPEQDKTSIFAALCKSVGGEPQQYRQEAERLLDVAKQMPTEALIAQMKSPTSTYGEAESSLGDWQAIANHSTFKYSRLFAIGLYTLLIETDADLVKDEEKRSQVLQQLSETLQLPQEKLQKDLDIYRSNLEKMNQLLNMLEETLHSDRKKREQEKNGTAKED